MIFEKNRPTFCLRLFTAHYVDYRLGSFQYTTAQYFAILTRLCPLLARMAETMALDNNERNENKILDTRYSVNQFNSLTYGPI